MESLQTGDILLFTSPKHSSIGFFLLDYLIEKWTGSQLVHCGIVLKDPTFIHPTLKGLYLWDSGYENGDPDPQDGRKNKLGVQITPIYEYLKNSPGCSVYVRRFTGLKNKDVWSPVIMSHIHRTVYNKPYDTDMYDWLLAGIRADKTDSNQWTTKRFWCSSFVTYVLSQLGLLSEKTEWDIVRPVDLSTSVIGPYSVQFKDNCYSNDVVLF